MLLCLHISLVKCTSGLRCFIGAVVPKYCAVSPTLTFRPDITFHCLVTHYGLWHFKAMSLSISAQVFHDIAYKAKDRRDLLAGIDEFLDEVIVLPPGEWDPAIRIEPPKSLPSSDKRSSPPFCFVLTGASSALLNLQEKPTSLLYITQLWEQ